MATVEGVEQADTHDVGFRPYLASDFEAVAALWTRVHRELAPAGTEALFEQYIATTNRGRAFASARYLLAGETQWFWVVASTTDGSRRIVGTFGIGYHNSDTTELWRMYIDAGWRGRGLAQRMLGTSEEIAHRASYNFGRRGLVNHRREMLTVITSSYSWALRPYLSELLIEIDNGGV